MGRNVAQRLMKISGVSDQNSPLLLINALMPLVMKYTLLFRNSYSRRVCSSLAVIGFETRTLLTLLFSCFLFCHYQAAFGKCFLDVYDADRFVRTCEMIRILNAVRDENSVGMPITVAQ